MDLLKKMESVQQRADQVDLKAERRNRELTKQLENIESTIVVIQELNSRLVGSLSKFSERFNHIIGSIGKIETHLEDKLGEMTKSIERNSKLDRDLTERVTGFEERQHRVETKVSQLEKMFTDGTLQSDLVRRDELSELRQQLEAAGGQASGGDEDRLRQELEEVRAEMRDGMSSAAPAGDLTELSKQVETIAGQLRTMGAEGVSRPEMDATIKGLRLELDGLRRQQPDDAVDKLRAELNELRDQQQQPDDAVDKLRAELKELRELQQQPDDEEEKLRAELNELRQQMESTRGEVSGLAGGASAEDLDALREELAHAVTDIEAVRDAPAGRAPDSVDREELDAATGQLRKEMEQASTDLRGTMAAADDLFALREQLASHATELEAMTGDVVKQGELRQELDKLRQELDDAKYRLKGSLSSAATSDDLEELKEQIAGLVGEQQAGDDLVKPADLDAALNDLRFEFSSITDDLRHSVAGAASADDLDAIKQRLAGNTAEFKAVAQAVMPQELEAAVDKLRNEYMAAMDELYKKMDGADPAGDLAALKDKLESTSDNLKAISKAATRDDLTITAARLREDLSLAQAEVEGDLKALKQQLELALNDIEFIKSTQAEQGNVSVDDLRIEMAAVQAALQQEAPPAPEDKTKDIEGLHKQFVGLAMDVSSTEAELKKRMDELQRKNRMLEQDIRKKLADGAAAGPVVAGADGSVTNIKKEMEKITTGYARKSEVNTAIKETNAAFRKIVQDFDSKQVELQNIISAEGEARMQRLNEKTEEAMSRVQHMINEFSQQMDSAVAMHKEFKDLKQQMILTQNAIMELNQFVEDQLKRQG